MKIIYLHGFASSGKSPKIDALRAEFGDKNVIAPDLPMDPLAVIEQVSDLIVETIYESNGDYPVLVGTSLGGFYARYLSLAFGARCILINPSYEPSISLRQKLGVNKNYSTGAEFEVNESQLVTMAGMESYIERNSDASLVTLLQAADDNVVDADKAFENIDCRRRVLLPTGGHRFDSPDAISEIIKAIRAAS